jgi:hypothetical protein
MRRDRRSPLLCLLAESGVEPTLDDYLEASGAGDILDAELLDVIPAEFAEEYRDRCRLSAEYENKFAEQQGMVEASRQGRVTTPADSPAPATSVEVGNILWRGPLPVTPSRANPLISQAKPDG